MAWDELLRFLRGPMFYAALVFFLFGMFFRLFRVVLLGWQRDRVPSKGSKIGGVVITYLKSILILPFIPWVKLTFNKNALTYVAGGVFHLSLFGIIFFGAPHMLVWKSILGFGWPTLPAPYVDWLAAIGIISLVALLINRLVHPVLKKITRTADWFNWTIVFLPFITGYVMSRHLWFEYQAAFSLHMIAVDLLLIWIPLSRISHFMLYFFSRTIHGAQFGKRAVTP
ncbi:MAG: hypothetical protein P8184_05375 [Calditrichia bacterium]